MRNKSYTRQTEKPKEYDPMTDEWSRARKNHAISLMKSPLGEQAVIEGWHYPLFHFCRKSMRLPAHHEIQELKNRQKRLEKSIALAMDTTKWKNPKLQEKVNSYADDVLMKASQISEMIIPQQIPF